MRYLFLNLKTTFFRLFEWLIVVLRYYTKRPQFIMVDLLLAYQYLWKSPHRISKQFLKAQGATNIYAYGETPLTTLDRIATQCRITSKDIVYELGSGSGRTCFWLATFVKCKALGIDYLPAFIQKANCVKRMSGSSANFLEQDMLTADLKKASVIYLYGTCLEEQTIHKLAERFDKLAEGVRIITVSFPLSDYSKLYKVTKEMTVRFPWGKAYLFLNEK